MSLKLPRVRVLGHVALVRLPEELDALEHEVGLEIIKRYPPVRTVLRIYEVEGPVREPKVKLIAGEPNTETVHRENKCLFKLDASKLMFSLGNFYERVRMTKLVKPDETVVDMFAGVGQFTIPITVHAKPRVVYAFEYNIDAYRYLLDNIKLNKVQDRVRAVMDDNRNALRYGLKGMADRIIMGYFPNTVAYFETALKIASHKGAVIHFHDLARKGHGWRDLLERCREIAYDMGFELILLGYRMVKSYSPSLAHWVLDIKAVPR